MSAKSNRSHIEIPFNPVSIFIVGWDEEIYIANMDVAEDFISMYDEALAVQNPDVDRHPLTEGTDYGLTEVTIYHDPLDALAALYERI